MTLSEAHLIAISRAAQAAGGDMADAEDLASAWERWVSNSEPRVDAMRREAARPICCCDPDGWPTELVAGRCSCCQGWAS